MRILELLIGKTPVHPEDVDKLRIKHILVIRQHDQLGDFLLSTPVLRALREHFPAAHIALLVRNYTKAVALHNQYIDELIVFQEVGHNWTFALAKIFLKQVFRRRDLTIVLNTVSHSVTSDLFALFSRAPFILGSSHVTFPGCKRNFLYNLLAPYREEIRNQSQRNMDVVRYLGIDTADAGEHITLLEAERKWAQSTLVDAGINPNDLIIGVHPGAGKLGNRWRLENFALVANELHRNLHAKIVINHGPNETLLADMLIDCLQFQPVTFGKLALRELAAIISKYDIFICNDTGVLHVAAAVKTPLVAIFGPTESREWKPIGDKFLAIQAADGRCDSVSARDVLAAVEMLLGDNPKLK